MTDAKLKSIVDRIERLEEEQRGIGQDKRDIFTEAKSNGYNPKVLRRLIRERKRDTAEQAAEDAELETYRAALGMAVELVRSGLSQRKAAKQAGVSKSSLNRALAVPAVSHDPDTGEITQTQEVQPAGTASGTAVNEAAQPAAVAITESCGGVESNERASASAPNAADEQRRHAGGETPAGGRLGEVERTTTPLCPAAAGVAPGPQDLPKKTLFERITGVFPKREDDLEIPPFLDRRAHA